MKTYLKGSLVKPEHIEEINSQLEKFGSKVSEHFLDGKEHILVNVLSLACGNATTDTTYKITLDKINSIKHTEFELAWTC